MPSRLIQIRLYATPPLHARHPHTHPVSKASAGRERGRLRIRWCRALPLARRSARLPACDVSLSLRISSTLCTSSGGFAFFSFMYRSRWRPREEDVKAWWQYGHSLSLEAGVLPVDEPGVPTAPSAISHQMGARRAEVSAQ